MGLCVSAPVGQAAAHSPQETQVLSPIGRSRSKAMYAPVPLPARPMTSFDWISLHARMQRSQRMHAWRSTAITAEVTSRRAAGVSRLFEAPTAGSRRPLARSSHWPSKPYPRPTASNSHAAADVNDAHPADADRLQSRLMAERRDRNAELPGRIPDACAGGHRNRSAVEHEAGHGKHPLP